MFDFSRLSRTLLATTCTVLLLHPTAALAEEQEVPVFPESISSGYMVFTKSCIISPQGKSKEAFALESGLVAGAIVSIAAAAIPTITSYIFDRILSRAKKRTFENLSSTIAKTDRKADDLLYSGNLLNVGCLTFVRPPNDTTDIDESIKEKMDQQFLAGWRTELNKVEGVNLSATDYPELVFEATIEAETVVNSSTNELRLVGFYLRPVTLAFGATGAKRIGKAGEKDLLFELSISGFRPTDKAKFEWAELYKHEFVFDDVPLGTLDRVEANEDPNVDPIVPNRLIGKSGPIMPLPLNRFSVKETGGVVEYRTDIPLEATIKVTEVEEGGDLARAVLDSVEAKKSDLLSPFDEKLKSLVKEAVGEAD